YCGPPISFLTIPSVHRQNYLLTRGVSYWKHIRESRQWVRNGV
ncbi:16738_t:CDS:2, partial [Gigaspora rosea]